MLIKQLYLFLIFQEKWITGNVFSCFFRQDKSLIVYFCCVLHFRLHAAIIVVWLSFHPDTPNNFNLLYATIVLLYPLHLKKIWVDYEIIYNSFPF